MHVLEEDRICGNCKHWDIEYHIAIKADGKPTLFAPCKIGAVKPDAGQAKVFLGINGNCWNHRDAFEPSAEYEENAKLANEQWAQTA